jgi:putative endopeptidase
MRRLVWVLIATNLLVAYRALAEPALNSGIDLQYVDHNVRPQDDFYRYVNGKWLVDTTIPADKGRLFVLQQLSDQVDDQLRGLIESLQKHIDPADPDQKKIADLYASFTDEAAVDRLGLRPLKAELARVDAVTAKPQIISLIAHFNRIGIAAPYTPQVHQDAKDPSRYVFDLSQDGLGMPDRAYYLQDDDKLKQIRALYVAHVAKMLSLAGDRAATSDGQSVLTLESMLAKAQWSEVDNRDPIKTYNKLSFVALDGIAPGYDWKAYLANSGAAGRVAYVIVSQPSYISAFNRLLEQTPLSTWKAYFRWHLISDLAPYLSERFAQEHFSFYGTALRGIERNEPRWKLGIVLLNDSMGEALGRFYVARYFPPEYKTRADHLVANLLATYRDEIETLDWMSPETKKKAEEKLAKYGVKIGYPAKWRDYGALRIDRDDLLGNVIRANTFEYERNLEKLGKPVDRSEWNTTPQTVNAHYDPEHNEIVFTAAMLQPPFFNAVVDDAANYGSAGFGIAHEISHGFDDQGSQYDGDGKLLSPPGWFTQTDLDRYRAKTQALIAQASAFEPIPGYHVNGELTLGENIADVAGLAVAYKAYKRSLGGKDGPVIDGMTGDQRLFMAVAQVFRGKTREREAIMRIKADPHPPLEVRGTLPEMNLDAFYAAFGVHSGDKMYLPSDKRVTIW